MTHSDPTTLLEERLAHTSRLAEDLSDIVAAQAKRIDMLEKRVAALMDMARDQAQGDGSASFGDQPPPHW
nr:SlyX family protein [Amylibacter sp.]